LFDYVVEAKEKLYVRFGDKFEELDDNIIVIPRNESKFNISQYIYEFVVLSIPYKKVHLEDGNNKSGCDSEMLKRLNEFKAEEKKISNNDIDPRWDKLKNLN
jgi:uncharacterized metal-binding protein YceD (DUF177 family)